MIARLASTVAAVSLGCALSVAPLRAQTVEIERGLQPLVSALHVHSTFSNGRYDISSLADMAEQRGIDVLGITDSFITRARYGVGPWKKLVSRTMGRAGAMDAGIENYLSAASDAARLRNIIVLPGVEVTPYYYWKGSYLSGLQLFDFDRHLLVFGLSDPTVFQNLPVIENETWSNTSRDWSAAAVPAALIAAGLLLMATPIRRTAKLRNFRITRRRRFGKIGLVVGVVGVVWLYDAYPFGRLSDPYSGRHDTNAYQQVITYVQSHGGVTIWSYPEAQYPDVTQGRAHMVSRAHAEDLWLTHGYSSFEGLYGDRITATAPGGMWDRVLTEYATGRRQSWPTIITGLDFHDFGPTPWYELKYGQTILWSAKKDAVSVLEAITRGRGYAVFQGHSDRNLLLKTFALKSEGATAIAGETLAGNAADLVVSLEWDRKPVKDDTRVRVTVVRDGKIIDEIAGTPPIQILRREENAAGKHYYRIMANDGAVELLSNPIFWEAGGQGEIGVRLLNPRILYFKFGD